MAQTTYVVWPQISAANGNLGQLNLPGTAFCELDKRRIAILILLPSHARRRSPILCNGLL